MRTFLDDVAKKILTSQFQMDQVKIIVPNIRAANFLKESLKKEIDLPLLAPEIVSISEFITDLSGISHLSKTDLLYTFYQVYKAQTPKANLEPFNQFFSWAPSLLQEFNEIDNQLVNPEDLFSFMNALSSVESLGTLEIGDISKRHFKFQEKVPDYYKVLCETLLKNQKGYAGLQLREAVRNLVFYTDQELPYHFFVGFNALSKAEGTIIQELIAEGKAEVIWDIDKTFYEDPYNGAGYFIREYFKKWKVLNKEVKPEYTEEFSTAKKIEIISTAKNSIQAKKAAQIASNLYKNNPNSSTVIVLGDENLLQSILSVLPEKKMPWNVTMGYPLKETSIYIFFKLFFELHENYGEHGFPFNTIYEFSKTAYCSKLLSATDFKIDHLIEKSNRNYITSKELMSNSSIGFLLFSSYKDVGGFLDKLIKITSKLKSILIKQPKESLQIGICNRFISLFESLFDRFNQFNYMNSLKDIKMIFESLIEQEFIDFTGDPLSGVQIMGLLETRLLDFENVIITNANEGILPFGKTPFSWIPFDIRKKFEMNTFIEQDHLYAYHFFRLLQRAKKIFLMYNATAEGLFSGERSRFLLQLEYFKKPLHDLKIKQLELQIPNLNNQKKIINKTQAILNHLARIGQEGFSPSSIAQYIRNPFGFYEQRMLKVIPMPGINHQLSSMDKGTLMHEVLETLYEPYISKSMKTDFYDNMLKKLSNTLEGSFNKIIKNKELRTGKNALVFNVINEVLKRFLVAEKHQVLMGNQIKILALEHKFLKSIYIKKLDKNINFKGTVDRIDIFNDTIRIVDYKTGSITGADMVFSSWEELRTKTKKSALFQVLLYAYMLQNEFKGKEVIAGLIPLKTFKNDFLAASQKENIRETKSLKMQGQVLSNFEKELFKLINEIFDPSIPFEEIN